METSSIVCPACQGESFTIEESGLIRKKRLYTCKVCKSVLKVIGNVNARIVSLGDEYSIISPYFVDKLIPISSLQHQRIMPNEYVEGLIAGDVGTFQAFFEANERHQDSLPIILKKDEKIALRIPYVIYAEERSKRKSTGYSGTSIRVAKGLSFRVGSVGESSYSQELTDLDQGEFVITNKRYFFVGSQKNISQPLMKITIVDSFMDALAISRENKQKTEYFKNSNFEWIVAEAMIRGLLSVNI
jgi:hypothetical protein